VWIEVDPLSAGTGFEFVNKLVGGSIPREYVNPTAAGVKEAMETGTLAGFPMVDLRVTLVDGSYHEVDSSEMAFKIAGSMALKNAVAKAAPLLLEPIMKVEVVIAEEFLGDIMGDINARRGDILGADSRAGSQIVRANVPLAEMFGYATELRSMTHGRATHSMEFSHYAPVPSSVSQDVVSRARS